MSASSDSKTHPKKSHMAEIPRMEWIISAVGLAIVVLAISVLIYEAVAGDKSPPDVKLTVETISPLRNGFLVKIRAENEGGEPAARVQVKAELLEEDKVLEESDTQFEYLPPHSSRDAGVFFTTDPNHGEVRLRAHGYEEP
ncbi:MAG: hypothetical protein JWQ44_2802 [Chthoniobacter sp.]|nr:hypothetical protein [Chthoniobacter sp.]